MLSQTILPETTNLFSQQTSIHTSRNNKILFPLTNKNVRIIFLNLCQFIGKWLYTSVEKNGISIVTDLGQFIRVEGVQVYSVFFSFLF